QAKGRAVDARTDIFAFGAVLYEMLSGKQAFSGDSVSDILASVLKIEPDSNALPVSVPASIRKLVERCLTKNHKQRLQAIGEARISIEDQLSNPGSPILVADQTTTRSSKLPWILAAAGVATALVVSFIHFRETPPQRYELRYTMAVPENSAVNTFALSPDG